MGGNQLGIGNYELRITNNHPKILQILIQTITKQIHSASQNQGHQGNLINHGSDNIIKSIKPIPLIKVQATSLKINPCKGKFIGNLFIFIHLS